MKKSNSIFSYISNAVCFLLLLVLLGTQCLPFWLCEGCKNHEEAKKISIAEYTLFPTEHRPVKASLADLYFEYFGPDLRNERGGKFEFKPNDAIVPCLIVFVACILSAVVLIRAPGSRWLPIFPLAAGIGGMMGYTTILALQGGANWMIHFIVAIVVTAASGGTLLYHIIKIVMAKTKRKAEKSLSKDE